MDGRHEGLPGAALRREHPSAFEGQPVVAPPALPRLLDPPALDPAALLEPVEQRIERRDVEAQRAVRARLDQLADVVAVPGPRLEQREDHQLGAPLLQFAVQHPMVYISHSHTLHRRRCGVKGAAESGRLVAFSEGIMKRTSLEGLYVWSAFQPDRAIDFNGFFWRRRDGGNV